MKILILSLLVLSMSAVAADKKVSETNKPREPRDKTLNIENRNGKEEIVDETATLTHKNPIKAHVTCKTKDGNELRQGDHGYAACIKKVKEDKHNQTDPKADVEVKFEK